MNTTKTNTLPDSISTATMVKRAGQNVATPRVIFKENVYDGTLAHANNPFEAIDGMKDAIYSEFEQVSRKMEFPGYTKDQIQYSLQCVLDLSEEGISQPVSNDPTIVPSTQIVDIGYDWNTGLMRTIVVPSGGMSLPGFKSLNKDWKPVMQVSLNRSGDPVLNASVLRRDQNAVEGLFQYVKDHVQANCIYRGQVIDVAFDFIKLTDFQPKNVALTETLRSKIELFVTGPLSHPEALDARKLPRKSGIFLYGPPGGGKTMAKTVCEYMAARMGACVVEVDPSLGISGFEAAAKRTEVLLEAGIPVVIGMEDMEKLARHDRAKVLDILDGTNSKGQRRITIGTTNFLEQIDRAMLRPGRFDAVEFCGLPDRSAFEHLVKVLISAEDRGEIDYDVVFPFYEGFSYAFIANAVQTILRAAINTAKGDLGELAVSTDDLITAAHAVRGHFDLMQEEVEVEVPALDSLFNKIVDDAIENRLDQRNFSDDVDYSHIDDMIHGQVDSIVEARLNGATLIDNDGDQRYEISTN